MSKVWTKVSHCGMDVHRTFRRLTARDEENQVVFCARLEHRDGERCRQQLGQLPRGSPVILEGTFGWAWMARELQACGLEPHLCNGRKVDRWRDGEGVGEDESDRRELDPRAVGGIDAVVGGVAGSARPRRGERKSGTWGVLPAARSWRRMPGWPRGPRTAGRRRGRRRWGGMWGARGAGC